MAVLKKRISSISELQLPLVFSKERPFEFKTKQARTRQEADDSDKCRSLKHKFSKITIEKDPSKNQEKEENQDVFWSQEEELGHLAEKFAPHQMALERFQEKMKMFLQEEARTALDQEPEEEETSEEERKKNLHMLIFSDMKLLEMKKLFRFSFFYEVCLERIRYVVSKELEPLREAILETEKIIQTVLQMLLSDREWPLENTQFNHDHLDNSLIESKLRVEKLFEESVFFQGELPMEDMIRYTSTESRISFALGLKIDFLDKLKSFDDELASHWNLEEWILNFLSNNYEDIDDDDRKEDLSKDLLIKLGFRDNSQAIKTILTRSALLFGHVEPIELVKRFVKDELKYHPVFAQELYLFPYTKQACTCCVIHFLDGKSINVMHMNFAMVEDSEELYEQYISKHIEEVRDVDSVILFHGTDHCSAIDILNQGIDINRGMFKHDFSDGLGFYLNDDYKNSETWSFSQTRKPAVLVFKVPKTFLENSSSLDLSEEDKRDDWLQIVTECRSGRPSRKLRKKLKTYDMIRGPISKPSDDANRRFEPRENSHQVCIMNEDCADEIREFLNTIISYE